MKHEIISVIILCISTVIFIAIFGRMKRSRNVKTAMLIAGNITFIISEMLRHYHYKITEVMLIILYAILNIIALRKIFSGEDSNREKYNAWHDDPVNWKAGIFYFNPQDKRIFPPKRVEGFGWTVNFANPFSILALIGLFIVIWLIKKILQNAKI